MAVSYAIDGALLRMRLEGAYEPQDIIRQFETAMNDPDCPERVALLLDVTRSEVMSSRSPHEIRLVAEHLGPYAERIGHRSAVVAGTDVQFGLGRMGSAYADGVGVEVEIFRDEAAALDWLKVTAG